MQGESFYHPEFTTLPVIHIAAYHLYWYYTHATSMKISMSTTSDKLSGFRQDAEALSGSHVAENMSLVPPVGELLIGYLEAVLASGQKQCESSPECSNTIVFTAAFTDGLLKSFESPKTKNSALAVKPAGMRSTEYWFSL